MKTKTEKEIIEYIKKWSCYSADGNVIISDWERNDIRKFFGIKKEEIKK